MADKFKYILAWIILIGAGVWMFMMIQLRTPIEDGLILKYKISSPLNDQNYSQTISFIKSSSGQFDVIIKTIGVDRKDQKDQVDKEGFNKDGHLLTGPIGGILWIPPYTFEVGGEVMGSDVTERKAWRGFDVYVVKDRNIDNCQGFYDAKTGLQVGYQNFWSPQKLEAILVDRKG